MSKLYMCRTCGVSPNNSATWCDLGCGNDYNQMILIDGRNIPALLAVVELVSALIKAEEASVGCSFCEVAIDAHGNKEHESTCFIGEVTADLDALKEKS